MKNRTIISGLCALFAAGVLLTSGLTTSAMPVESGPSASGHRTGLLGAGAADELYRRPAFDITTLLRTERVSTPFAAFAPAVTSPAIPRPAAYQSCAPVWHYLFAGGWYDLLDNEGFEGSPCTPNWVFPGSYTPSSSTICNSMPYPVYSKVVVLPDASGFYQDFFVPEDVSSPLEIAVLFATVGTPGSSDKIILQLRESGTLKEQRAINTASGPFSCRRVDITFANNHAGESLRLRVQSAISTPGVQYHIEWIQIFGTP